MLDAFVTRLKRRLTLGRIVRYVGVGWVCGGVIAVAYALTYVLRGHAVPWGAYAYILAVPVIAAASLAWWRRTTPEQSAAFADRHFGLKDILSSAWHFKELTEPSEAHSLVLQQSTQAVAGLDVSSVPLKVSRRLYMSGLFLCALLIALACIPPSASVLAAQNLAASTRVQSAETQAQLEALLESLDEALDEEEVEAIDLESIRQAIDAFEVTDNPREALRQVARIEQHLATQMAALEQRSDEAAVRKMAAALKQTPDPAARQLAAALEAKQYANAAEKLEALAPSEAQLSELSEQAKAQARLRAVSKPMAQALSEGADPSEAKMSLSEKNGGERSGESMAGLVGELDQQAEAMGDLLEAQRLQQSDSSQECAACNSRIQQSIASLGEKLTQMDVRRGAQDKLAQMRRMLSQAPGSSQMAGAGMMPGGQGAGEGSDSSRRDMQDPSLDRQQYSQLAGLKNAGPSMSKIEEATDGSAVSRRSGGAVERSYQRQFESFVQRDDIPDSVKFAVGNYFETIHRSEIPLTHSTD